MTHFVTSPEKMCWEKIDGLLTQMISCGLNVKTPLRFAISVSQPFLITPPLSPQLSPLAMLLSQPSLPSLSSLSLCTATTITAVAVTEFENSLLLTIKDAKKCDQIKKITIDTQHLNIVLYSTLTFIRSKILTLPVLQKLALVKAKCASAFCVTSSISYILKWSIVQ